MFRISSSLHSRGGLQFYLIIISSHYTFLGRFRFSFLRKIAGNQFFFPAEKAAGNSLSGGNFIRRNFSSETHFYLIGDMAMMKHLVNISNL